MNEYLERFLNEEKNNTEEFNINDAVHLLTITWGCRASMHEPDGQGLHAKVTGRMLDNAGCEGEYQIILNRDNGALRRYTFNLVSLIALARLGAEEYLKAHDEDFLK